MKKQRHPKLKLHKHNKADHICVRHECVLMPEQSPNICFICHEPMPEETTDVASTTE